MSVDNESGMEKRLRILFLEDAPTDIELIERELEKGGIVYESVSVETESAFLSELEAFAPNIILADYLLPGFDGITALSLTRERDPDIPFIFVSGTLGEEHAIDTMKHGATDYVLKQRLSRLVPSVTRSLAEWETKRKKREIEATLSRKQLLLDNIINTNPAGILTIKNDSSILIMNPKARDLLDIDQKDELLLHASDIEWCLDDTDGVPIPVAQLPYQRVLDTGNPIYDYMVSRDQRNGKRVILSISCMPLRDGPVEQHGVVCTINDVTQLHMAQVFKQLSIDILNLLNEASNKEDVVKDMLLMIKARTGVEAIGIRLHKEGDYPYYTCNGLPDEFIRKESSLFARDKKGKVVFDSDGVPTLECMCGNIINQRFDPEQPFFTENGSFWTNSTTELLKTTPVEDLKTVTRNRCNSTGFESVALIPLHARGGIIGLLQINDTRRDRFNADMITFLEGIAASIALALERKDAVYRLQDYADILEEKVRERTKELERAQEKLVKKERLAALGKLAGGMSHELRNPLGAIKNAGYFLNIAMTDDDPEIHESINIIMKETDTAERIIGSMLDFARPRSPEREEIDVDELIDATIQGCAIPDRILVIHNQNDNHHKVSVDTVQLSRVFTNLIQNAVQAMPTEGTIRITTAHADADTIRISFQDTGIGISEDHMQNMFEPLFTTKAKGIGLGLAISKTLVERHGGSISVSSTEGMGSEFTILLPRTGQKVDQDG